MGVKELPSQARDSSLTPTQPSRFRFAMSILRSPSLREHKGVKCQPLKTLFAKYMQVLTAIHRSTVRAHWACKLSPD